MKLSKILLAGLMALSVCLVQAKEISFGVISTDSASAQRDRWEPFFRDMEKQTGLTVKSFYAPDYAGVIEAMRFNKVQVAWFGNKAAMEAVDRASGEVFAQVVFADGAVGYTSYLITQKDSPYNNVDDVIKNGKSINFGIGDPNSTSGFLVPTYYIFAKRNIEARETFKTVRNASHGVNLQAILAKQLDVATNNSEEIDRLTATKPESAQDIKIIWKSPLIPSDPFVWRTDLDKDTKEKLKKFVFNYAKSNPEEKAVLKNIYNYGGFRPSTNAQLNPIRQLELFKDLRKVESDTTISDAEKAKKVAELNEALAKIK
ncbi:phosphonate ABC transporter substrate-binding protein [Polynucleobacter campilacus]|jgi:phosphonate transport system substrate-binding protein|uniref:Phosphonate ABC transporter substrate-binding protein n=1 Tax=Polynucleobacter campilacus TaxID=1743163 RepID=A0A254PRN1_9BURK|nr:phosphonate ABC transporter substrate-binding protein [Polynucleobacter campilacus]OWS68964.1 phosphonate ABC transporter substrate-binding protein [Polynucleobacter campilacus]